MLLAAWTLLPAAVTGYQISAKWIADGAARRSGGWLFAILSSPVLAILIGCEIASFALWMYVLARMPLSEAFPLSAISYVFVLMASWILFHEPASVAQIAGSAMIVAGVWLIGRRPGDAT